MEIKQTMSSTRKGAILSCSEPIEKENAELVRSRIESLSGEGISSVILDLSRVQYISGAGLSMLLFMNTKIRESQGLLILAGMNREVSAVFSLLGFSRDCICASTLDEAREMAEKTGSGTFSPDQLESEPEPVQKKDLLFSETGHKKAGIPGEPLLQEGEAVFSQPLIVECEECCSFIRVHTSGQFLCPSCHVEFHVERDGTVIF